MAQEHRLQRQRFELKYLIPKEVIPEIRGFVSSYLELDDFCRAWPDNAYPIYSLYLDSPDLKTYTASVNGVKNRFKLRVRYYDALPSDGSGAPTPAGATESDGPVFLEIKGRVDNCILKQRCPVKRTAVPLILSGHFPDLDHLPSREARHLGALQQFSYLVQQIDARPRAYNRYRREAWVSPMDNSVRVTMDREVQIRPCFDSKLPTTGHLGRDVFDGRVVLELKFTARFPTWLRALVEHFGLMQTSASKYADGIVMTGERLFQGEHGIGLGSDFFAEPETTSVFNGRQVNYV